MSSRDNIRPDELKETLQNKLDSSELEYFRDICNKSADPPAEYFIEFPNQRLAPQSSAKNLVKSYPAAVQRFIEIHDLQFQPGKLAISGIIDELVEQGYDREVLNKPAISQNLKRLLLVSFDAFYDPQKATLSAEFDLMVGRSQIRHKRTDSRYEFDVHLPSDEWDTLSDRIKQFESTQNHRGDSLAIWHGPLEEGLWVKLFKKRNRRSEYVFEETDDTSQPPTVTTQSRYPVKTLAAKFRETNNGLIVHTFDNLDQSGMKKTFRKLLQTVTEDEAAFESFEPIESSTAKSLVSTAVDEAEQAVEKDPEDVDVLGTVQQEMNELTEQLLSNVDDVVQSDDEAERIQRQLGDSPPVFIGIEIPHDERTGIERFRIRSTEPFYELGGQVENFNEATRSLLREVDTENIQLVFRMLDVGSDTQSIFTVTYGDWSDIRGVDKDTYDTLEQLLGVTDE